MTTPAVMTVVPKMSGLQNPSVAEPTYESLDGGSRSQLAKAELTLYNPKKGLTGQDLGAPRDHINFQFNPKELTVAKTASWTPQTARSAKKAAAPPQFNGAGQSKLNLELFFDASDNRERNVVAIIEKLFSCCVPTPETANQDLASPPLVVFKWGALRSFPGYLTSVSAKYTLFAGDGTPIRAIATIAMEEMPGVTAMQNPTSGSLTTRRERTIIAGETLASLAFKEYGDPNLWRALAYYNRIDDPLRLKPGTPILVPGADDLDRSKPGG